MGYFSSDDVQAICGDDASEKKRVREHFLALHKKILEQIDLNNIDLHSLKSGAEAVSTQTISHDGEGQLLAVQYTRNGAKAVSIERLMGREDLVSVDKVRFQLHPSIELRLSDAGLTIELLISPDAWWDQQNLKGKLSVPRHRHEFYTMLMDLQIEYCMGFWQGTHLSDMHLTGKYFQHPRILDEWLGTFHPGADWFRIGVWYDIEDELLAPDTIVDELLKQIQTIYPLYQYFLWVNDNNFREFATGVS